MSTTPSTHHGLSFLPQLFETGAEPGARLRPLSWQHYLILAALLIPPVALPLYLSSTVFASRFFHEHAAHAVLEGFCALMSLVVFYVLHQEYVLTGTRRLRMIAYGFLAMGILDLLHAASEPGSTIFV